jgi:hypothetical protein
MPASNDSLVITIKPREEHFEWPPCSYGSKYLPIKELHFSEDLG